MKQELKETYERLFGKLTPEAKPKSKNVITESQQTKWSQITSSFTKQFPTHSIRLKEGYVLVDNLIVDKFENLISKSNQSIVVELKSFVNKK